MDWIKQLSNWTVTEAESTLDGRWGWKYRHHYCLFFHGYRMWELLPTTLDLAKTLSSETSQFTYLHQSPLDAQSSIGPKSKIGLDLVMLTCWRHAFSDLDHPKPGNASQCGAIITYAVSFLQNFDSPWITGTTPHQSQTHVRHITLTPLQTLVTPKCNHISFHKSKNMTPSLPIPQRAVAFCWLSSNSYDQGQMVKDIARHHKENYVQKNDISME